MKIATLLGQFFTLSDIFFNIHRVQLQLVLGDQRRALPYPVCCNGAITAWDGGADGPLNFGVLSARLHENFRAVGYRWRAG